MKKEIITKTAFGVLVDREYRSGDKKLGRRRHFGAPPSSCHGQSSWCLKRDRPKRRTPSCFNWGLHTSESCEWSGRWGDAESPDFPVMWSRSCRLPWTVNPCDRVEIRESRSTDVSDALPAGTDILINTRAPACTLRQKHEQRTRAPHRQPGRRGRPRPRWLRRRRIRNPPEAGRRIRPRSLYMASRLLRRNKRPPVWL